MSTTLIVVSGFGLAFLTQFIKGTVYPKWGATGVHILMFVLACAYVVCTSLFSHIPSLKVIFEQGVAMLATAITTYEVLLSKIGFTGANGVAPIATNTP